jgi:uncharacterized repeat protein (TIGR01451 family)
VSKQATLLLSAALVLTLAASTIAQLAAAAKPISTGPAAMEVHDTPGSGQGAQVTLDSDPLPSVSIGGVDIEEGDVGITNAIFPVRLSAPSSLPVTVGFYTHDLNATAGIDYIPTNGVLTFAPGETNQTIVVMVLGDTEIEPGENFQVILSNPTNALLAGPVARGRILNDDGLPGRVDHFVWEPITSPQYVNQPFAVTVTALDVSNALVTNFTGRVALAGDQGRGARTNAILGNVVHTAGYNYGTYTLGYSFTPNTNLLVTHVRHYSGTKVSIWTDSGTLLVTQNVVSVPGFWVETPLAAPVQLLAGTRYRLGCYTGGQTYYLRSDMASTFRDGTIDTSYEIAGDAFPIEQDSTRWNFVDLRYTVGASKPVAIAPVVSGDFTNGVWPGAIMVQEMAANVALLANDLAGHTGWSGPFETAYHNDLAVEVTAAPNPVAPGSPLTYTMVVTNTGPLEATAVTVTNILPGTATFVSAGSSQGSCSHSGGTVTCELGLIPGGANAVVTIHTISGGLGQMTNRVTVGRAEADAYTNNNGAVTVTTVAQPSLFVNDVSVLEGDRRTTEARFAIQLSPPSTSPVSVRFAAVSGSATMGADFISTNGLLAFAPGETNQAVTVLVVGDTLYETNETFLVNLFSPTNALLGKSQGVGTILNDDPLPTISIGDVQVTEGNVGSTNVAFAVNLSGPSALPVTVNYFASSGSAWQGADFVSTNGVVTFDPGQTNRFVLVTVLGDTVIEGDEQFYVTLWGATNAAILRGQGACTILDDDGVPGRVDHFAWDAIATPQYLDQPFGVRLVAQDASNATVTSFTDTVLLSATQGEGLRTNAILWNMGWNFWQTGGNSWTIGYAFTPKTNLTVTHVRGVSVSKVSLWTDTGTLLASQAVPNTPQTWVEAPLATPVELLAGQRYRLTCYTLPGESSYGNGSLATNRDDVTINACYYAYGDTFPTHDYIGMWFLVDIIYTVGRYAPVSITPAVSSQFVNGIWSGNITVRELSTFTVLAVDDRDGHGGRTGPFDVCVPGDVSLAVAPSPAIAQTNSLLTYTLSVSNPGPAVATGVIVSNLLPAAVTFLSSTSSQGSCTLSGNTLWCDLGSLEARAGAVVQVRVGTPSAFGNLTNLATLWVNEPDPNPTNNFVATVTPLPAPPGTGLGLYAQYFDNMDLTGATTTRLDSTVNFNWSTGSPDPAIGADTFSARWTGAVQPLYSEVYTFFTYSDEGVRLWVDGQQIINNWTAHTLSTNSGSLALEAGRLYQLRLEYFENTGNAAVTLAWASTNQALQAIPRSQLYPLPVITTQPASRNIAPGATVTFSVAALGQPPLTYQWRCSGTNIADATNPSLPLTNVQLSASGGYSVEVSNVYGAVTSRVAILNVGSAPVLTSDPQSQIVLSGSNVTFSASASGSLPLSYRWRKGNTSLTNLILNESNCLYVMDNAQTTDAANYTVVITNAFGPANRILSSNASLSVINSTNSQVTTDQGSNATFTLVAASPSPLSYQWYFNLTNLLARATNTSLLLTNVQASNTGQYHAVVTNSAGSVTALVGTLSVTLRDSDRDGMPDDWETAHGLNPADGTDAKADPDRDGMSNLDEWIAGTDPQDPLSVLKATLVGGGAGGALISFTAMPNITYTLQYRTNLIEGEWLKLTDVVAHLTMRTVEILDPDATAGAKRYYRIATPNQP